MKKIIIFILFSLTIMAQDLTNPNIFNGVVGVTKKIVAMERTGKPMLLTGVDNNGIVTLNWVNAIAYDSIHVYKGLSPISYSKVKVLGNVNTWKDTLSYGEIAYYYVQGFKNGKRSLGSNIGNARFSMLASPINLMVSLNHDSVVLTWDNPSIYDSIYINYGNSVEDFDSLYVMGNGNSWIDTSIVDGIRRYYRIAGKIGDNMSSFTAAESIIKTMTVLNKPWYIDYIPLDTIYVKQNGLSSGNGQTPQTALNFDGLYANMNSVQPGTMIAFEYGDTLKPTYNSPNRIGIIRFPNGKNGTSINPIVIGAYGDNTKPKPYISDDNCSGYFQMIRTGSMTNLIIRDMEIDGEILMRASENINTGLDNIIFYNNTIRNKSIVLYNAFNGTLLSEFPDSNKSWAPIRKIVFDNNTLWNTTGNGGAINAAFQDSCIFRNNRFYNVQEEAIDCAGGRGHLIENNIISGASANGIKLHGQYNRISHVIVRGNVIIRAGTSSGYGLAMENTDSCHVYNNTIISGYSALFGNVDRIPKQSYFGSFRGNQIYNNIFAGTISITGSWSNSDPEMPEAYKYNKWYNAVDSIYYLNSFSHNTHWDQPGENTVIRFYTNGQYPNQGYGTVIDSMTTYTHNVSQFAWRWANKVGDETMLRDPAFSEYNWLSPNNYGTIVPGATELSSGKAIESDWNVDFSGKYVIKASPNRGALQSGSTPEQPVVTIPNAPTNLSAVTVNNNSISLSWSDNSSNESSFILKGGFAYNSLDSILTLSANLTNYRIDNLLHSKTYYYQIGAKNSAGISYSNIAYSTTGDTVINQQPVEYNYVTNTELLNSTGISKSSIDDTSSLSVSDGWANILVTGAGTNNSRPLITFSLKRATATDSTYRVSFDYEVISGNPILSYYSIGGLKSVNLSMNGSGSFSNDRVPTSALSSLGLYFNGTTTWSIRIRNVKLINITE